jgi:hypothetical protein
MALFIPGPTTISQKRHDWTGTYSYVGVAVLGTADSTASWRITRLTVNSAGAVTATGVASNVAWTNRYSATYT